MTNEELQGIGQAALEQVVGEAQEIGAGMVSGYVGHHPVALPWQRNEKEVLYYSEVEMNRIVNSMHEQCSRLVAQVEKDTGVRIIEAESIFDRTKWLHSAIKDAYKI